jgi:hypothetical protein
MMGGRKVANVNTVRAAGQPMYANFGPKDDATERKRLVTRRLKRMKVTLPVLKCLQA